MERKTEELTTRSKEIQEVLTKIPRWTIRWGNAIILLCIAVFLIYSSCINYPEKLACEFIMTTEEDPFISKSNSTSNSFQLHIQEGEKVEEGQVIISMDSKANYRDILFIKSTLDSLDIDHKASYQIILNSPFLELGPLSKTLLNLEEALFDYYQQGPNSSSSSTSISHPNLKSLYQRRLINRIINEFKNDLQDWEDTHIYKAKSSGSLYFPMDYSLNQSVKKGDVLFSIYKESEQKLKTIIKLPNSKLKDIAANQRVILKLKEKPLSDEDVLFGIVGSIDSIPDRSSQITSTIILTKNLSQTHMQKIFRAQKIKGNATLLIKNRSILASLLQINT